MEFIITGIRVNIGVRISFDGIPARHPELVEGKGRVTTLEERTLPLFTLPGFDGLTLT